VAGSAGDFALIQPFCLIEYQISSTGMASTYWRHPLFGLYRIHRLRSNGGISTILESLIRRKLFLKGEGKRGRTMGFQMGQPLPGFINPWVIPCRYPLKRDISTGKSIKPAVTLPEKLSVSGAVHIV